MQLLRTGVLMLAATFLLLVSTKSGAQPVDLETSREYVVVVRDGPGAEAIASTLAGRSAAHHVYHSVFHGFSATLSPQAASALRNNPNVELVEASHLVSKAAESLPSGIDRVDAELVHPTQTGIGARVAIVDTGIQLDHPDLAANIDLGLSQTFVSRGRTTVGGDDDEGHGTHVAGTVAAIAGNGIGVVGMAPGARLVSLKVLNSHGSGTSGDIIAALDFITAHNDAAATYADMIHVANFSLGGSGSDGDSTYRRAFERCVASGCFVVVAAGNSSADASTFVPAAYDSVFTVSAFDPVTDVFAYFSNFGADVDMAAPGVSILSTTLGNGYGTASGTSMASPHVAGAAALYVGDQLGQSPAPETIRSALLAGGEIRPLVGDTDGLQEPILDAEGLFGGGTPPTPGVFVTLTSDKSTYSLQDATAILRCQPRDEYGVPIEQLDGSEYGAFSTTVDGSPSTLTYSEVQAGVYETSLALSSLLQGDHTVEVAVTAGGLTGLGSAIVRIVDTPIIFVSNIGYRENRSSLFIDITVSDNLGQPVAGATVSITLNLNGAPLASGSGATDSTGLASFRLRNPPSGSYTTTIDNVVAPGAVYDPLLDATDPGAMR